MFKDSPSDRSLLLNQTLIATYQLLNSEDKKLFGKCRVKIRNNFFPLISVILLISLIASFILLEASMSKMTNPFIQLIMILFPAFIAALIISSIIFPRYWILFCEEKSIIVEKRDTQGFLVAINQYMANTEDYYSKIEMNEWIKDWNFAPKLQSPYNF